MWKEDKMAPRGSKRETFMRLCSHKRGVMFSIEEDALPPIENNPDPIPPTIENPNEQPILPMVEDSTPPSISRKVTMQHKM